MSALFEEDITEEFRMPWPLICKLACQAHIRGISMDKLVDIAIRQYLQRKESRE